MNSPHTATRRVEMEQRGKELTDVFLSHAVVAESQYDTLCASMAAEILRLRHPDERREWQPIETAPKQLDEVLLYWPYWTASPVIGGRNYQVVDEGFEYFDTWSSERWLGDDAEDPGPTHWMPLPTPPEVQR